MKRAWSGLLPTVCPVCRIVPKPPAKAACQACSDSLEQLPTPRCHRCGGVLDGPLDACGECLRASARPWTHATSAFRFDGLARQVVHRFKYQGETALAPLLAEAMAENWRKHGCGQPDVVVPVPLHWAKLLKRGYNQAELLAQLVGRRLELPYTPLLRRRRRTKQQAMLDFDQRQLNMRHVFAVRYAGQTCGRHVLLVDDVLTTGATLSEAVHVLLQAQATAVSVLTAARG